MWSVATWVFAALALGGTVFYILVVVAAVRHGRKASEQSEARPSFSILKPLFGVDQGLAENLRAYFRLDYPDYEVLFGIHTEDEPAAPIAKAAMAGQPPERARIVLAGEPPSPERYPNAKNWNLLQLAEQARGDILVIADSDVRPPPDNLQALAADFADPRVGVVTCLYRASGGPSLWSKLEAIGMNTEFWGGALVAQMLAPMDFAVGPTMAIRRSCLDDVGGFEATRDYLAEDFLLGNWARKKGWEVLLSRHVVEHRIGSQGFADNFRHRLRWYRSTRCSRPLGYLAQVFTYPLPFALALPWLSGGAWWAWGLLSACLTLRLTAAVSTARLVGDRTVVRNLYWLFLQDLLSFVVWLLAMFGNEARWRTRTFRFGKGGRLIAAR